MTVVSVNVGKPQRIPTRTGEVLTSIFKEPVNGPVRVGRLNLDGDQQSDLRVHGGIHKAVYIYPSEHYQQWRQELPDPLAQWGMFGENLTTAGVLETDVRIGDRLRFGSAVLQVTQPRMPCFKLALRMGRADMVKRFWASRRSGYYVSVVEEGIVEAGAPIVHLEDGKPAITVSEIVHLYQNPNPPRERVLVALDTSLAGSWKAELRERLSSRQENLWEEGEK